MLPLNRADRPPRAGPDMRIIRVKQNQTLVFTVLSDSLWGCYVHWNGNKSEPCFNDKKKCAGHKRGLPVRWKGYLHVYNHNSREECFVELTPTSAEMLLDQLGRDAGLRGNRINITRGASDNARLRVTVLANHGSISKEELPAAKDPYKTLVKLWGLDDIDLKPVGEPTIPLEGVG